MLSAILADGVRGMGVPACHDPIQKVSFETRSAWNDNERTCWIEGCIADEILKSGAEKRYLNHGPGER